MDEADKAIDGGEDERPPFPKRQMSPAQIASWNLTKALKEHPSISKEQRQILSEEMLNLPQLRVMNMSLLASALVFLERINNEVNIKNFQSNILLDSIEPLMPDRIPAGAGTIQSAAEREDIIIKLKTSVLRYITAVVNFRRMD